MWSLSDEALVSGFAAGEPDAAAAFVRRFQARVFGLAMTMVGDAAIAEEISQEAFVRAWRHAPGYDPRRGRVTTWILAITRNLAIDHLRSRRPEPIDPRGKRQGLSRLGPGRKRFGGCTGRGQRSNSRGTFVPAAGAAPRPRSGLAFRLHGERGGSDRGHSHRHRKDAYPHGAHEAVAREINGATRRRRDGGEGMTTEVCDRIREDAPELVLGLLGGEERASALGHLAECDACRAHVRTLADAADELLELAPRSEPPVGFEDRVFAAIRPRERRRQGQTAEPECQHSAKTSARRSDGGRRGADRRCCLARGVARPRPGRRVPRRARGRQRQLLRGQ